MEQLSTNAQNKVSSQNVKKEEPLKEQPKLIQSKQQNLSQVKTPKQEKSKAVQSEIVQKKNEQEKKLMKCAMITKPNTIQIKQVPIPIPASGEVLIKVMAAPINPSDLLYLGGNYTHQKKLPSTMGFEGSGTVVASGGGMMGWSIKGKKVAFGASKEGIGSYAQYAVAKVEQCLPLTQQTSFQQGCMSIINPMSAIGMLDIVKQRKQKCVVLTAAASALGRMINRLFPSEGVEVINVVRKEGQEEILKKQGAKHVINSSKENFQKNLTELAEKMGAKTCYECVGGEFTGKIMKCMPKNSIITVFGCLSQENIKGIDVSDLLSLNKTLNSFMLMQWLHTKSLISLLPSFYKVRNTVAQLLKSNIAKKFKLDEVQSAIKYYQENMTEGKIIIQPWSEQ